MQKTIAMPTLPRAETPTTEVRGPFGSEKKSLSLGAKVEGSDEIQRLRREAAAKSAEADQKIEAARQLQYELEALQTRVDNASDRYARAETQAAGFESALIGARNSILITWGNNSGNPFLANPDYSAIAKLESAVADWARVEKILKGEVASAEAALKAFQQSHKL